ncbi:MAG: carbamoyltransferase HypF [Pseudomonadota bacterium]
MPSLRLIIGGRVQGVGFRPFVYRLACSHGIGGWVRNRSGVVEILAQGEPAVLDAFTAALIDQAPPLAQPALIDRMEATDASPHSGFAILPSDAGDPPQIHVPPDYFACPDCLGEMRDPQDRRYRYPFINCTQCGPRYTLIARLPYDRPNTSMAGFPLCPACRAEYENPANRRFHAEPVACPQCGPRLKFVQGSDSLTDNAAALRATVSALRAGAIVAVKGVGGYHLLCDASSDAAVQRLRTRKRRPHKPLAVMFPQQGTDGLDLLRTQLEPTADEAALLGTPPRPIVLCRRRADTLLAPSLAPGLNEIGALLPYAPLHHLLLDDFGGPLVATSGNVSGEPVLTDNGEAARRLAGIADAFLHHDRPILRPADDPVWRSSRGTPRPLRLGRGNAPLELPLPLRLDAPLLAVGGHMKNSLALAWEDRIVISPHIGDLDAPRALAVFAQVAADLQQLYGVQAQHLVCDAHPGYASSRWARQSGLPVQAVQHHHAHAGAVYGEHAGRGDWLVFTWDGTGLGSDGTLWGGEALCGRPGRWQRVGSLRPFHLPGGDRAGREPWRAALGLLWECGPEAPDFHPDQALLQHAWQQRLNTPQSSAAGRLFDAAAALTGLCSQASFEGQGPMLLEAIAPGDATPVTLPLYDDSGVLRIDWTPLLPMLRDDALPTAVRAGIFHASLAAAIAAQAQALRRTHDFTTVALGGGVFQNRLLTELAAAALEAAGFTVRLNAQLPCNDGGLCYGQVIEAAALAQGITP